MWGTGLYVSPVSLPASIVLAANVPISLAAFTCCDRMAAVMKFLSSLPPRGTGAQATSPAANTSPEGWLVRNEESVRMPPSLDKTSVSRKSSELGTDPIPTTTKRAATQTCAETKARQVRDVSQGVDDRLDFGERQTGPRRTRATTTVKIKAESSKSNCDSSLSTSQTRPPRHTCSLCATSVSMVVVRTDRHTMRT